MIGILIIIIRKSINLENNRGSDLTFFCTIEMNVNLLSACMYS